MQMVDSPRGAWHLSALENIKHWAELGLSSRRGEHVPLGITQGALIEIIIAALDVAGDSAVDDARAILRDRKAGEPGKWPVSPSNDVAAQPQKD